MTELVTTGVEKRKRGRPTRIPRTICPICKKPAVAYPNYRTRSDGTRRKNYAFEHRDEPPIRLYNYKGRIYKVYRRCVSKTVDTSGSINFEKMSEVANKQYIEQQILNEDYYKKLYLQLRDEYKTIQQEIKRVLSHYPDPRKGVSGN